MTPNFPSKLHLATLLLVLALLASACGSDGPTSVETADSGPAQSQPADGEQPLPEGPIPVEPDGGIGDGAGPIPGFEEEPEEEGTWHGAEVAVTNCPGMEWTRVQASEFSFSVPSDFIEREVQPVDSEVRIWNGPNEIEVSYDYGWYSGSRSSTPGAENEALDFSGVLGERTVLRGDDNRSVSILFEQVKETDGQWDRLSINVNHADPNDEIIGRCIVRSIEWGS